MASKALEEAMKVDIVYCMRIGKQKLGYNRHISITLSRCDDKERIMGTKSKLPQGIYINNEYPIHVKRARDKLHPILRYVKSLPNYRDKSKIEGDHLVINGVNYGIQDIDKLPSDILAYKSAQKENDHCIAFHHSNFHHSKFMINNSTYHSAEQWIQFQKAIKRLSYNINGFNSQIWRNDGYELCLDGITQNFLQNPPLLKMLKTTEPKTLVEATLDKQ